VYDAGWEVKEQVAIAAMDCAANRFAFQLVEAIRNEFPGSKRADRLTVSLFLLLRNVTRANC